MAMLEVLVLFYFIYLRTIMCCECAVACIFSFFPCFNALEQFCILFLLYLFISVCLLCRSRI